MLVDLFEFQQKALDELRERQRKAQRRYIQDGDKHIIPFTAPTGAGKTIIMSAFIEALYCGDTHQGAQNDAIVLWLSDSPELNEQSKMKLYSKADKLLMRPIETIDEKSFKADKLQLGTIYFVNTQKFGANSNLIKYSNERNYTGWDFMRNTVEEYGEKLVVIIDEAHRGAKTEQVEQMTIMQKFVLGSTDDNMPSMPLVIGMSATIKRFNELANNSDSTQMPRVEVTADEVRESGLLKDKINIHHPNDDESFAELSEAQQRSGGTPIRVAYINADKCEDIDKSMQQVLNSLQNNGEVYVEGFSVRLCKDSYTVIVNILAGFTCPYVIFDEYLASFDKAGFNPGINARISYLPIDIKSVQLGFEVNAFVSQFSDRKNSAFSCIFPYMSGQLNLVTRINFCKGKLGLNIKAGGGLFLLGKKINYNIASREDVELKYYMYPCASGGISIDWIPFKHLILEAGCDFTDVFIENMNSGFIVPYVCLGLRF